MSGGPGPSGNNAACAACKYQRRKCTPDCPLAPYFPPDQPKRFHNVHKLYGVSNILRILRMVDPSKREDTVKSIVYEADTREKDPVHGCLGVISLLQSQVSKLREELALVRDQLYMMEQHQHTASILNQAYGHHHQGVPATTYVHHQLQQQYGSTSHANFHDSTVQTNSFNDKSLQPAYHNHSRYAAESTGLHDMLGHQLKTEADNPTYSRGSGMSHIRYGAVEAGASLQQENHPGSNTPADLQRRNVYNQMTDHHHHHVVHNVDSLVMRTVVAEPHDEPSLTNPQHELPDYELRNAGVHLSLTNQYNSL